jgi:hypothetical protein
VNRDCRLATELVEDLVVPQEPNQDHATTSETATKTKQDNSIRRKRR